MRPLLTPRMLAAHLLALVCVVVAAALGAWQLDAWQERRAAEAADLTRLDPVPLDSVLGNDDPFPGDRVGQPVVIAGSWLPEATVFVSDREHDGADGYWVVTPLTSGDPAAPAVPVVRGWVDDPASAPAAPSGTAELVAWLQPSQGNGAVDDDPRDDVYPQLRIADLVQRVDQDLYGAYAVVADEVAEGPWPSGASEVNAGTTGLEQADLEQLPPTGRFTALRNLLYALEWWVFGAFAGFIWWRFVKETQAADRLEQATPDPVASGT